MRFFISPEDIAGDKATINGEDAIHIGVCLRARPGDKLTLCDGNLFEYSCEITSISKDSVSVRILSSTRSAGEMPVRVHLFQSLAKGDRLDTAVQKATEAGVYDITLVNSKFCIARFDEKSALKKTERFSKIAEAAAKQSGRGIIPRVFPPVAIHDALRSVPDSWLKLFCYEDERGTTLKSVLKASVCEDIALFIGAEGGYDKSEVDDAVSCGFTTVGLGSRILRCETAGMFALACICYEKEL